MEIILNTSVLIPAAYVEDHNDIPRAVIDYSTQAVINCPMFNCEHSGKITLPSF